MGGVSSLGPGGFGVAVSAVQRWAVERTEAGEPGGSETGWHPDDNVYVIFLSIMVRSLAFYVGDRGSIL